MPVFRHETPIAATAAELFDWHARPGAFERLTPPWEEIRVEARDEPLLADGAGLILKMRVGPGVTVRWVARHEEVRPGEQFVDVQEQGPFASWRHVHRFEDTGDGHCRMIDEITWEPPGGSLSRWLAEPIFTPRLRRTFRFRHRRLADDLARHHAFADRGRLRVAVTGASGLVGSALVPFLRSGGHTVHPMVRRRPEPGSDQIHWSVGERAVDVEALEGVDAVVHLAGAPIAGHRWTEDHMAEVKRSRVEGTALLCESLARLETKPKVLISGSATGFYGDGGDRVLTEEAEAGDNFLAEVCQAWEAATRPAEEAGIRVVHLRTGIVLAGRGGALEPMLPPFKAGVGGPIGGGGQYVPFVALEDMVGIIHQALFDERFAGPVNATAPEPVSQRDFAHTLGRVLGRPSFVPTPGAALELAMGRQMARELVLEGQRAVPARLLDLGFPFRYPKLEEALRFELGRE